MCHRLLFSWISSGGGGGASLLGLVASAASHFPSHRCRATIGLRRRNSQTQALAFSQVDCRGRRRRYFYTATGTDEPVVIRRSPELIEMEYGDLNLQDLYGDSNLGHIRIRQHVNPLSSSFSAPVPIPDWQEVFKDPTLPLMVDIGCGSGRFLIWLAKKCPEKRNYLGLEIRHKLVQRSQFWVKELDLENIYFMFANATVCFDSLISMYPGPLTLVSILCPDPHFKKRHHKRRVLQADLVDAISRRLCLRGQVFLQSDVLEVALDMRNQFDACADVFDHVDAIDTKVPCDTQGWILNNPMGVRTEREIHAELEGAKIYRRMYVKQRLYLPDK